MQRLIIIRHGYDDTTAEIRAHTVVELGPPGLPPLDPIKRDKTEQRFDVSGQNELELRLLITGNAWAPKTELLRVDVRLRLDPFALLGKVHPRVRVHAAQKRGMLPTIEIDTTFLDVTEAFEKARPGELTKKLAAGADFAGGGKRTIRVLEATRTPLPRTWITSWSSRALDAGRHIFHPLMFLRPGDAAYTDSHDVSLSGVARYLNAPSGNHPHFVRSEKIDQVDWITAVAPCDFLGQLHDSKKPVVLALPVAHGKSWGSLTSHGTRSLLISLCRALFGGPIGSKANALDESGIRVAVGGFSYSAPMALTAAQQTGVDELYYFDPTGTPDEAALSAFLTGKGHRGAKRRLRLVGAMLQTQLLGIARRLASQGDCFALPREGHFEHSPRYHMAVWSVALTAQGKMPVQPHLPDVLGLVGQPSPSPLSVRSGVFFAKQPIQRPIVLSDGSNSANTLATREEVLGFVQYRWLPGTALGKSKLKAGGPTLNQLIAQIRTDVLEHRGSRHQWSVCGGEDRDLIDKSIIPPTQRPIIPADRTNFVGHLQYCLEKGNFPWAGPVTSSRARHSRSEGAPRGVSE